MFKNKEGKVRSGWKIAAVLGTTFSSIVIISIIIGIIAGILYATKMMSGGSEINLKDLEALSQDNMTISTISMLAQEFITIIIPIIAWKFIIKRPLSNMGLTPIKKNYKELLVGLFFGILSITFVFLLIIATGNAEVDSWTPNFSVEQLIFIPVFISVGFAEEILTRGFIMTSLRQMRNVPAAILISSVIFSLMHSLNTGIGLISYLNIFLVGILFAYMYLKSGNLWMCIGYHITWNYFQGYVFGFKVSGHDTKGLLSTGYDSNNIFNGGAFGPEGGLFVTIIIVFGLFFVRQYYKDSTFDFIASEPTAIVKPQISEEVLLQNQSSNQ